MASVRRSCSIGKKFSCIAVVCLMLLLVSCGGYEGEPLVVRLTPAVAAIAMNSSVEFYADGNFGKYSTVDWKVVEAANLGVNCTVASPTPPPACTAGSIEVKGPFITAYPATRALYHSPSTPGTYNIEAVVDRGDSAPATARASVTVLP